PRYAPWDRFDRLPRPDGGTVSLQWTGLADAKPTTPVLMLLPTIAGTGDTLRRMVDRYRRRMGWIVIAANRRGLGQPLTSPRFNTLGDTDDLRAQIEVVRGHRPKAPLFALGLSAGSGLLARYLGEEGARSAFAAAVMISPAYDMELAFRHLEAPYNRLITRSLVETFVDANEDLLAPIVGFHALRSARRLGPFHDRLFPLAGFSSRAAYYRATNPMVVADQSRTPALVLNALDDPVCPRPAVEQGIRDLSSALTTTVVATTDYGSHCAFYEGWPARSWSERAAIEYLHAAHALGVTPQT
ncbi:MAG: alpha/beta fold hydrolase, partial [Myxococcota bacterium]